MTRTILTTSDIRLKLRIKRAKCMRLETCRVKQMPIKKVMNVRSA